MSGRTFNPFDTSKFSQQYLDTCRQIWSDTTEKNVYPIFTLKHLSLLTTVDYKILYSYTRRNVNPYKKIVIQQATKKRTLLVPWQELSLVQNWIKKNILDNIPSSEFSTAYDKNCSIFHNATKHKSSQWLIKLDIQKFFDSIYEHNVFHIFKNLGYSELISLELARLCTYNNHTVPTINAYIPPLRSSRGYLPQGASTSPKLANLFAKKLDNEIHDLLESKFKEYNLIYTRYSDDIAISGDIENKENCQAIIKEIEKIFFQNKLHINRKKTKIYSPQAVKKITGINIVNGELRPPKTIINYIKTSLYHIKKYGIEEHLDKMNSQNKYDIETYKEHLLGKIFFVLSINKTIGNKLLHEYNELLI